MKSKYICAKFLQRRSEAGFTLIEALVVVLIVGIVSMLGFPAVISGLEDSRLSGATTEVIVALEFGQMTAMTTGTQIRVTLNDTTDSILVQRFEITADLLGSETQLAEGNVEGGAFANMKHPIIHDKDYSIVFADEDRLDSVDIATSIFGANNYVTFDATGGPSAGGTVTLTSGSRTVTITVDALTGKVTSGG